MIHYYIYASAVMLVNNAYKNHHTNKDVLWIDVWVKTTFWNKHKIVKKVGYTYIDIMLYEVLFHISQTFFVAATTKILFASNNTLGTKQWNISTIWQLLGLPLA